LDAVQLLRGGDLQQALDRLQDQVRADPSNPKLRVFLFQLFAVLGQWDRALKQLAVVKDLDAEALLMVQTYEQAIRCEALRSSIFAGQRTPLIFGQPEPWIAQLLESLRLHCGGNYAQAVAVRDQAFEQAPASAGTIRLFGAAEETGTSTAAQPAQSESFDWLADADTRLGPMLEAIVNGNYYWIPLHRIGRIDLEPPTDLRDLVWMPAHFVWANQGETVGLIPTRYVGSEQSDDDQARLSHKTLWTEVAAGIFTGTGQRMFTTDRGEYSLLDIRQIEFASTAEPAGEPTEASDG
jgi:type VI secretion system protein ImpE